MRAPSNAESYYLFRGGCVRYDFDFDEGADPSLVVDVDRAVAFEPRGEIADEVRSKSGLDLCGAGESCPGSGGSG